MHSRKKSATHSLTSAVLLCLAILCLLQGISKGILWFTGSRAPGLIVSAENTVSTRGAYWHRYNFTSSDGKRYDGSAMAVNIPLYTKMQVAYLPLFPDINMPAYGTYTALFGVVWTATGLLLLGLGRLFRKKT